MRASIYDELEVGPLLPNNQAIHDQHILEAFLMEIQDTNHRDDGHVHILIVST